MKDNNITMNEHDTGQKNIINKKNSQNNDDLNQERAKLVKNRASNGIESNQGKVLRSCVIEYISPSKKNNEKIAGNQSTISLDNEMDDSSNNDPKEDNTNDYEDCKEMNILMEYNHNDSYNEDDYVINVVDKIVTLLGLWMKKGAIGGVYGLEHMIVDDIKDIESWMIDPKVVYNKSSAVIDMVLQLKTTISAHSLYQLEQEYCNRFGLHLSSKNTINAHTKKIGFLTRTYVKLASPKYYVNELEFKAEIEKGYVEIKKKYTFDKGVRSKVLVIYAVKEKAKEISLKL